MTAAQGSVRRTARKPGSQSALRQSNQRRIVDLLQNVGPSTQAEISRRTGLSAATVSNIVKVLNDLKLVEITPTTSSGRRAVSVRLLGDSTAVAGIDFGRRHVRVVISRLGFQVVAEQAVTLPIGYAALDGLKRASELLDALLEEHGMARSSITEVGVGIPGPIDVRTETVVQGSILPEWVGVTRAVVEKALGIPAVIDNDANLGALAEVTWGAQTGTANLMFVKIGSGIGSGLILNGMVYRGHVGISGEIGHSSMSDAGLVCRCGNRGCLETVASTSVIIELLSRGLPVPLSTAEVVRQALEGDPATLRVIDDVGAVVGRALANSLNLIGPELIVIGGSLAELGEILLGGIRRGLMRYAVPVMGENTSVVMSSLGDRAEALGAAALAIRQISLSH
jgi:predicted NBD/HSP70 family sugar kinase